MIVTSNNQYLFAFLRMLSSGMRNSLKAVNVDGRRRRRKDSVIEKCWTMCISTSHICLESSPLHLYHLTAKNKLSRWRDAWPLFQASREVVLEDQLRIISDRIMNQFSLSKILKILLRNYHKSKYNHQLQHSSVYLVSYRSKVKLAALEL